MKNVLCVIIACLIIFGIYSCAPANINNVTTDGDIVTTNDHDWVSKEMTESDFFDFSKTHKSSDEDMK